MDMKRKTAVMMKAMLMMMLSSSMSESRYYDSLTSSTGELNLSG